MNMRSADGIWNVLSRNKGPLWVAGLVVFGSFVALTVFDGRSHVNAEPPKAAADTKSFDAEQTADIEKIVRDYLLKNPMILIEMQKELEQILAKEEAEKARTAIAKNADQLFRAPNAPVAGNLKGDIPVVEFFDYNCGYCKRSLQDISRLVESDPNVKVVFMEYPILSKGSLEAAKVALAARNQGKYWEVHRGLFSYKGGRVDGAVAKKIAKDLGLDMERLEADLNSQAIEDELNAVQALATSMDINGTPHFLVGDRSIPGAPRDLLEQIKKNVSELRKEGCSVC